MLGTCLQKHNFACQKTYTQEDDILLFCFVTLNNGDNKHCMDIEIVKHLSYLLFCHSCSIDINILMYVVI
jgi:hypothetical protein